MRYTFHLYGLVTADIEHARAVLEDILGVAFSAHESGYLGDYYRYAADDEELKLRRNVDLLDGEPAERRFAGYPVLLEANQPRDPMGIRDKLTKAGITLLEYVELA